MKRLAGLLCALLFLMPACGTPSGGDVWSDAVIRKAKARGKLRVALEPGFRPFEYLENGKLVGFDIDLATMIAGELGVELEFIEVAWDGIMATLDSGKADLIISGMTATPLRALKVNYSDPYFHTDTITLLRKELASTITSVDQLDNADLKITVKLGTTGEHAAKQRMPKATLIPLANEVDCATEVALGRADAFVFDRASILGHHEKHPDTTHVLDLRVSVEPYAIACPKGDVETVAWLNLMLHHLRRDGRLDALYAKYGLVDAGK